MNPHLGSDAFNPSTRAVGRRVIWLGGEENIRQKEIGTQMQSEDSVWAVSSRIHSNRIVSSVWNFGRGKRGWLHYFSDLSAFTPIICFRVFKTNSICSTINIYTLQDKVKIRMSQILNILKWKHIKDTSTSRNKVVFITQSIPVAATEIQRKHNLNVFLLLLIPLKLWTFKHFLLTYLFLLFTQHLEKEDSRCS